MPPKNLKSGFCPAAGDEAMYTAAAVFGGSVIPGRRKTVRCVNFVDGRVKIRDVGAGAAEGVVINGEPVGTTPKSCGRSAMVVIR